MFKKLKKKFVILNMTIISVVLFISFAIIYIINYNNTYQEIFSKLEINNTQGIQMNTNLEIHKQNMNNDISSFNIIVDNNGEISEIFSYYDYDEYYYTEIFNLTTELNEEIEYDDEIWFYTKIKANNLLLNSSDYEYIYTYVNITDEVNSLQYLLIGLILTWSLMLGAVFYICLYFSSKYIKPIEDNYDRQKRFIADASHELKTPIAIISANADAILLSKDDTVKNQEKWINYIKNETLSMSKLVNDLLNLAKSEEIKLNINENNISNILEDSITSLEAIAFEKNVKIKKQIDKNIIIKTDKDKLKQVFIIFLDNAIKYSDEKTSIKISLYKNKKDIYFTIENSGFIDESELNKIFDRFYKCDKARTTSKSFGLGLSIANNILNDLRYTVKASSTNNKVKFIIKMK